LAFCPDSIGKNLTNKNPDDRALRKCEKGDVADKQPYQKTLMVPRKEDSSDTSETGRRPKRADQQQRAALLERGGGSTS
jgi:hypothetical protein